MAIKAAIILVSISIILLAVYGADVAVLHGSDTKMGFLPFDHMVRGIGLGMPALILPFVSYIIARKDASKTLGALLIISAVLIKLNEVKINTPDIQCFFSYKSCYPLNYLLNWIHFIQALSYNNAIQYNIRCRKVAHLYVHNHVVF